MFFILKVLRIILLRNYQILVLKLLVPPRIHSSLGRIMKPEVELLMMMRLIFTVVLILAELI